ncbi:MAG: transcriptional regulator, GntR family [Ilumatobacteraceae bacterium]|nr:transcriptional regulator, GntR family [Ilumatobacteraceae bacterium]
MCSFNAERVEKTQPICRHIEQRIARYMLGGTVAGDGRVLIKPSRTPDVTIVVPDDVETMAGEVFAEVWIPIDHLNAEPHDQEQRRIIRRAERFEADLDPVRLDQTGCCSAHSGRFPDASLVRSELARTLVSIRTPSTSDRDPITIEQDPKCRKLKPAAAFWAPAVPRAGLRHVHILRFVTTRSPSTAARAAKKSATRNTTGRSAAASVKTLASTTAATKAAAASATKKAPTKTAKTKAPSAKPTKAASLPLALETRPGGANPLDVDLVDKLVTIIQDKISSGELPVGSWLRQERLAQELGVSRMPVREALRQLQTMGALEVISNRGARVRLPSLRDITEVYELRGILEGHAAATAAQQISGFQIEQLQETIRMFEQVIIDLRDLPREERAQLRTKWQIANGTFHRILVEASGNKYLLEMIDGLHRKIPRNLTWLALETDVRRLARNAAEHAQILEAIDAGNGERARGLVIEHARRASELMVRQLSEA